MVSPEVDRALAPVRALILRELADTAVPSCAVAVARDGRWLWQEGFGWADRARRLPATEHTPYALASITKPITATALMLLVERGQVDLDGPVNALLGAAPLESRVDHRTASVRQVANHTAGLPLHYHFFYADRPELPPPMSETIRRYGNLVTAPGERYQYSNLGYGILDHIVGRVSGRPFADFVRAEVFAPLGMTRSSIGLDPALAAFAATPYTEDGRPYPPYGFDHVGASAAFASAHDLVRFGWLHLGTRGPDQKAILADASLRAMRTTAAGYGLGWRCDPDFRGTPCAEHTGGMGGVSTLLRLFPEHRLAIAVLSNASTDLPTRLADAIAAALIPDYAARLAAAPDVPAQDAAAPDGAGWTVVPERVGTWRGRIATYVGDVPVELRLLDHGAAYARLGDDLWSALNAVRCDGNTLTAVMLGTIPTPDALAYRHRVHLDLRWRPGDILNGSAGAVHLDGEERRGGFLGHALSHWAELHRVPGRAAPAV